MKIKTLSLGPLGTNGYIVSSGEECLIFDPGAEPKRIESFLKENSLKPLAILLTHAHFDHIGAVDYLRKAYSIDVYLHEEETDLLTDAEKNRSKVYFGEEGAVQSTKQDHFLTAGSMTVGPFHFEAVHTPGHSPGSISFIFHEEKFVISGDVLFQQGIGRTDIPGGNLEQLMKSIFTKLYTLDDEFVVYPGHGPKTTIGFEKRANPFTLQFGR